MLVFPQKKVTAFLATFPHTVWSLRNSVKTTSLVKSFTVKLIPRNNPHGIQKFRKLQTVENYCKTQSRFLLKIQHFFRLINSFAAKELTKELISRKILA